MGRTSIGVLLLAVVTCDGISPEDTEITVTSSHTDEFVATGEGVFGSIVPLEGGPNPTLAIAGGRALLEFHQSGVRASFPQAPRISGPVAVLSTQPAQLVGQGPDGRLLHYELGDGAPTIVQELDFGPENVADIQVGDLSEDGLPDLVVLDWEDDVWLFKGTADGFESPFTVGTADTKEPRAHSLLLQMEGSDDVWYPYRGGIRGGPLVESGDEIDEREIELVPNLHPGELHSADLDNDGSVEAVASRASLIVALSGGGAETTQLPELPVVIRLSDADADGDIDIVGFTPGADVIEFLDNTGELEFVDRQPIPLLPPAPRLASHDFEIVVWSDGLSVVSLATRGRSGCG